MKRVYEDFVKKYDMNNKAILGKYNHSKRVMNISQILASKLGLSEREVYLNGVIGLFHDIARFKQETEYHTFNDLISFDHGDEGYNIYLKQIASKLDLSLKENKIVSKAIKYHNKLKIGKVTKEEELYAKIIRDADKLDIFYQLINVPGLFPKFEGEINPKVTECFFNHSCVDNAQIKTDSDYIVAKLAMFFDINFKESFVFIKENKYVEKLEKVTNNKELNIYYEEIRKFINEVK